MRLSNVMTSRSWAWGLGSCAALLLALGGCSLEDSKKEPFQVGTVSFDPELPPEPRLPTSDEVCATLEASDRYVKRPDGALPPEVDPSPSGVGRAADPAVVNPDQARIQAALNECGALVEAEVGATIAAADAIAALEQAETPLEGEVVHGVSGEELAKPAYRASKYAVRLVKSGAGTGPGDSFISGPLTLPSGVTLWIDEGVTLFATRDVMAFNGGNGNSYCGNTAVGWNGQTPRAGSSGNCRPLIGGNNLVNVAVVGDGSIDSRAYSEIVTTNALYPLMKVDLSCSNTYAAFAAGQQAPDGTACDNGGTLVNSRSQVRNMTWWDLAYQGNMVANGRTGAGSQSCFRMMVFNYVKNLTLYRITLSNSANFHFVPLGIDGLTVWGAKVLTPNTAAYANPAGNQNPLYTGEVFDEDNVKNTDAFDPGGAARSALANRTIGATTAGVVTTSAAQMNFDGYLKNVVFAYNYVSTGDDDIVLKGSGNPGPRDPETNLPLYPAIDGNRDVRADRAHGVVIAHNHIYWGHGISVGSETNAGVRNVWVYDNAFDGAEEALRIKSDYARGGEVSNFHYENICIRGTLNALLYTGYYSTRVLPAAGPLFPNFHDLHLKNVRILDDTMVRLEGFAAQTGGYDNPQYPLVMTLENVVADRPDEIGVLSSDANLTLEGTNLPLRASTEDRVVLHGSPTRAMDPDEVVDCSRAFVDFPSPYDPRGKTW